MILGISSLEDAHAPVCDGYGYNLSTLYYHLNLGWSGLCNAWYALPTLGVDGYIYTALTTCVYNICPSGNGEIISGRVINTNGAPVANATVIASNQWEATVQQTTTDSRGIYALTNLASNTPFTIAVEQGALGSVGQFSTGFRLARLAITMSAASGTFGAQILCWVRARRSLRNSRSPRSVPRANVTVAALGSQTLPTSGSRMASP